MDPHMYLYERAREAYYRDLRRDMEERRRLSLLPQRRSVSRRTAGRLSMLLLKIGTWLRQFEQPATTSVDRV
jgi:hypothetical protein